MAGVGAHGVQVGMKVPEVQDPGVQVGTPKGWFQCTATICNIVCLVFNHAITGEICVCFALWFPLFSLLILTAPTVVMIVSALTLSRKTLVRSLCKILPWRRKKNPLIAICDRKSFGLCCQHAC